MIARHAIIHLTKLREGTAPTGEDFYRSIYCIIRTTKPCGYGQTIPARDTIVNIFHLTRRVLQEKQCI